MYNHAGMVYNIVCMTKKQLTDIQKLLNSIDVDAWDKDIQDFESVDELERFLQDNNFFDVEIIYYTTAMEYLTEHDSSLQESIGLALEMGIETKDIHSELLASLLASQEMQEAWSGIRSDIEQVLE